MGTITVLYRPVAAIISSAMTMLVGAYYSDLSGDLLLATDGLTLVRNQTTGEWRTEATDSVKSLRLSSEVAFSLWVIPPDKLLPCSCIPRTLLD